MASFQSAIPCGPYRECIPIPLERNSRFLFVLLHKRAYFVKAHKKTDADKIGIGMHQ
jgi:hypothetical protein